MKLLARNVSKRIYKKQVHSIFQDVPVIPWDKKLGFQSGKERREIHVTMTTLMG